MQGGIAFGLADSANPKAIVGNNNVPSPTTTATTALAHTTDQGLNTNNIPSSQDRVTAAASNSVLTFDHLTSTVFSPKNFLGHDLCAHHHDSTSASLVAKLNSYKYLDDYEHYRGERLKKNAMRKFGLIMQSIKTKHKDCSQFTFEEESDGDMIEDQSSEFSNFNQILRRHRKRFKQKPNNDRR